MFLAGPIFNFTKYQENRMNISGILVTAWPEHVAEVAQSLSALPGLEVSQTDVPGGKLVVVQEAASVGDEVEGFKRIRALPHVMAVDLVQHYFEYDNETIDAIPSGLDGLEGIHVPTELQD
jgi:nitrate reductase NapAB chaperone NapD